MTVEIVSDAENGAPTTVPCADPWPGAIQAWYAVFIFALTLMVNFLDRGIISLLVPQLKADLRLSDFQLSIVAGFALVLFYLILELPIARLADVGTRRTIIGVGIALWSAATALCGLAQNFWQLFACRVATGVGEACNGPATFSMLADLFPREKLPRAIVVMNFGFMAGTGLSLIIGGTVIHFLSHTPVVVVPIVGALKSWQLTFMAVGLPGLAIAALMWTVKEPARRGRLMSGAERGVRPISVPVRNVVRFVIENRGTYGPMLMGLAFNVMLAFGTASWIPAFYGRTYGWSMTKVGLVQGAVILMVWPFGAMFGSWLSETFLKKGYHDANLRVVFLSIVCLIPGMVALPLMPRAELAVALGALNGFLAAWVLGPQNAAIQIVTPNEMRGQITALALFVFNAFGAGIGPTFVAVLTDYAFGSDAQLRYALSAVAAVLGPLAAASVWYGMKAYARSVVRAQNWG